MFSYSRSITIDHTKCGSADSSNFPVLVSLSDVTLKTVGNSGHVQNSNGYDIYFYSDSGMTTRLAVERESYDGSAGTYVGWVNVPAVSHTSDIVIYIAYGDAGISTDPNSDGTYGKTSVWDSNYKGVYHLGDGTTLSVADSTGNNSSSNDGGLTAGTGQIGGGAVGNGSSQYAVAGSGSGPTDITGPLTISAWIKPNVLPLLVSTDVFDILEKGYDGVNEQYSLTLQNNPNTGNLAGLLFGTYNIVTGSHCAYWNYGASIVVGNYYYVVGSFDGSTWKVYFNGAVKNSNSDSQHPIHTSVSTYIGAANTGSIGRFWPGGLDEARISNIARSADWITTEYNNQNSPSTFYTLGSESGGASSLTIQDSGSASSADNVVLTQASGALTIQDSGSASSADTPSLIGNLIIADSASASSADNVVLTRNGGDLTIADSGSASSADNVALVGNLIIQDSGSASSADTPTLAQAGTNNFIIDDSGSASSSDNVIIALNSGQFAISDAGSSSSTDNIVLTFNGATFAIDNSGSTSSADNVTITQPSAYALNANLFVNTGDIAVQFTGLKMSSWNTANRPPPVEGLFGFNTETKAIEVYQGGIWN